MPVFSNISLTRLQTCDYDIQEVMKEAIIRYDFSVICGFRCEADQNKAYREGNSGAKWPQSAHNVYPSKAVDIAPWPIDWKDTQRFYEMAAYILEVAGRLGIPLVWGGNWRIRKVSKLVDLPHFELA